MPSKSIYFHNKQVQTVTTGTFYTDESLTGATNSTSKLYQVSSSQFAFLRDFMGERWRICKVQAHWYRTLFIYNLKVKESKQPVVANTFNMTNTFFFISFTEWFATWQQTLCVRAWLLLQKSKEYIYVYIYICIYTDMYTYIYIYKTEV